MNMSPYLLDIKQEASKYLPVRLKNTNLAKKNLEMSSNLNEHGLTVEKDKDCYVISINKNLHKPLNLKYLVSNILAHEILEIKYHVIIKENCQADIVEYLDKNNYDFSAKIESNYTLKENSTINHYIINQSSKNNYYSYINNCFLEKNALKNTFDMNFAQSSTYSLINHELNDNKATTNYYALDCIGHEAQNHRVLNIIHNTHNTSSTQLIKAAYANKSIGNFFGGVSIPKLIKNCSALQSYKSILLSQDAKAFVRPQMQIHNNEIVAKHGASIGELDQEALFYLQSRNLSLNEAKSLLLHAVLQEIINNINNTELKVQMEDVLSYSLRSILHDI